MYLVILFAVLGLCALAMSLAGVPLGFGFPLQGASVAPFRQTSTLPLNNDILLDASRLAPAPRRPYPQLAAALAAQLLSIVLQLSFQLTPGLQPQRAPSFPSSVGVAFSATLAPVLAVALLWWGFRPQSFPLGPLSCAALLQVWPAGMAVVHPTCGEAILGVVGWGLLGALLGLLHGGEGPVERDR
eukprot:RCo048908